MKENAVTTLTDLPEFMTPEETARVVRKTVSTLAQDRYLGRGLPYTRSGRKILYARADVLESLTTAADVARREMAARRRNDPRAASA
jgi:hypothetical protein